MDTQKKRHTDWKSGASWHWAESRGSHKWGRAYSHQQLQGPSKGSPLGPLERVWACQHWHFRLLALELWYSTFFFVCFQPWEMNRMSNITYHAWEYLMCSHLILIICSWKAEPWTYPSEYPEKMTVHCDCHVSSHRQVELPQRYMLLGASKKQR